MNPDVTRASLTAESLQAGDPLSRRTDTIRKLNEILPDLIPIYEKIGYLHEKFAEMILKEISKSGRPVIFLYRDGQFLRKISNQVRKKLYPKISESSLVPGLLSRTVFTTVETMEKSLLDDSEFNNLIVRCTKFIRISRLKITSDDFLSILSNACERSKSQTIGLPPVVANRRILTQKLQFLIACSTDARFPDELRNVILAKLQLSQGVIEARNNLTTYLRKLGCFDPFLDLADTGVAGSIMEKICELRDEYFESHGGESEFIQNLSVAYKISDFNVLRNIFNGNAPISESEKIFSVRTFMIVTHRPGIDKSKGFPVLKKTHNIPPSFLSIFKKKTPPPPGYSGSIFPLVSTDDFPQAGINGLNPYQLATELTHALESRLNGYFEPFVQIGPNPIIIQGETNADSNENEGDPWMRTDNILSISGLKITSDLTRRLLNKQAMSACLAGARAALNENTSSADSFSQRLSDLMNTLMVKTPFSLRKILYLKSPQEEVINDYLQWKNSKSKNSPPSLNNQLL